MPERDAARATPRIGSSFVLNSYEHTPLPASAPEQCMLQQSASAAQPAPWLWHQQDIYGVGSRVKNFRPTSEAVVLLGDTTVSG